MKTNFNMENKITELFGIKYPIIQGGMVWCSGWKLASAVSNMGGLGLLGIGSMHPETLEEHILKMKSATDKPWGVNLPLFYPELDKVVDLIIKHEVKIVFTSAGSPKKLTAKFHEYGIKVAHVIASTKFALKCEEAGVDAIVAEGFEAGGHNSPDETTTLVMIPKIKEVCSLPLIAAGGIGSGQAMLAAMTLGAQGVQIGSLFAASQESSASTIFKESVVSIGEGGTILTLKELGPVRMIPNKFSTEYENLRNQGASKDQLRHLLGKGRAKKGIFEGNKEEGTLEIGQVAASIQQIDSVQTIIERLIQEYNTALNTVASLSQL